MINPDLERRYSDCVELVSLWKAFFDLISKSLKTSDTITPPFEQQFLAAKARIAMLHDSFMSSLKHDKAVGANMLEIVNRAITLKGLRRISEAESRKMEIEWHEVFLLLNETVSTLNEERSQLSEINETTHKMEKMKEYIFVQIKWFFTSMYFKAMVAVAATLFVVFGFPAAGIYDWDRLRDIQQIRFVTKSYLATMRDGLGLDMAYTDMEEFDGKISKNRPTDITRRFPQTNPEVTATINRIAGPNGYDSEVIRGVLSSEGTLFKSYDYARADSSANYDTFAYIFWVRNTPDARRVSSEVTRIAGVGNHRGWRLARKGNVLVFVYSQRNEAAVDLVIDQEYKVLPPKGKI